MIISLFLSAAIIVVAVQISMVVFVADRLSPQDGSDVATSASLNGSVTATFLI